MENRKNKPMRVSTSFHSDIERVIKERILKGKDNVYERKYPARITEGISRHPAFRTRIMPDLIKADLPKRDMNKKGFSALAGIFIGLVIFIIFAFIIAVGSGLLMKVSNTLTSSVVDSAPETLDFKNKTILTAGNANNSIQQLSFFSWMFIIAMVIGILIASFMVKPSGITLFFWFLISSAMFLVAVFMSRAYEDLYNANNFIGDALHMTARGTSWLVIYLPHVLVVLTFIGGIILFMRMKKQEDDLI